MSNFSDRILSLGRFAESLQDIAVRSTAEELGSLAQEEALPQPDWNFALTCASALTHVEQEAAQDAILRVAQGCLHDTSASGSQKAAAVLLLQRVGNRPAIALADGRALTESTVDAVIPSALDLDAMRRSTELQVLGPGRTVIAVNPFQKQFWDLAESNDWVSISAPTSAGKSHIIREWISEAVASKVRIRVVYLAPTRALVEEVGASLRARFGTDVGIHTLPWDPEIPNFEKQVFVLTQERLHLLHYRIPTFTADILFVDEAQKIAEGTRGILMSQVIDETLTRSPGVKLIFASPLSANPEILISAQGDEHTAASLVGETVTVNQSLIFVKQVYRKPKTFEFTLQYRDRESSLGHLELERAPSVGKRLPAIATSVGRELGGNLVYANGPADAEKYAKQIFDELGPQADSDDPRIDDLISFAEGVVHKRFLLASVARRGVAFHYGDMPLVLKAKVESLFREGVVKFLVCTSTLLEGVNLPCRNIFVRGPKKGPTDMSLPDFWNLAGRAGRWGQEFQGNIVCVDATDAAVWKQRPGSRQRAPIQPAALRVFAEPRDVVAYIEAEAPKSTNAQSAELESAYSWVVGRYLNTGEFSDPFGLTFDREERAEIGSALTESVASLRLDTQLVKKHAGISPQSMQRLFDAILLEGNPAELALVPPASDEAFAEYKKALDFVAKYLGGSFEPETRRYSLARLIVQWMRGVPLSVMIDNRARWMRQQNQEVSYPRLIRKIMKDVESIARFEAPKYLACFADVVSEVAREMGESIPDSVEIDMMLELGVPRVTDMSFIALGLSRATTMAISGFVPQDLWSPMECAEWIDANDPEELDVANFAIRELQEIRAVRRAREEFRGAS